VVFVWLDWMREIRLAGIDCQGGCGLRKIAYKFAQIYVEFTTKREKTGEQERHVHPERPLDQGTGDQA
jgi:hypothetical protein